jgi:hypothetical protein
MLLQWWCGLDAPLRTLQMVAGVLRKHGMDALRLVADLATDQLTIEEAASAVDRSSPSYPLTVR